MRDEVEKHLDALETGLYDILSTSKIEEKTIEQSYLDGLIMNSRAQSIMKSAESLLSINAQLKKSLLLNDLKEIKQNLP